MDNSPAVSVLLPAYQAEPYIAEAVESVLSQTETNWELVISANVSKDKTTEIIKRYKDPRIHLIEQPKYLNVADNWNAALNAARAKYACVLGADDVFLPHHLSRKLSLLNRFPSTPFIYSAVNTIDADGRFTGFKPANGMPEDCDHVSESIKDFVSKMRIGNPVIFHAVIFRRGYPFRDYGLFMDWGFLIESALNSSGPIIYDGKATIQYRQHQQSATSIEARGFRWSEESGLMKVDLFTRLAQQWISLGFDPAKEKSQATEHYWALAFQQLRRGQWDRARRAWKIYRSCHSMMEALPLATKYILRKNRKEP